MTDAIRALLVMGVAGCGKSTVATALCSRIHAAMIEGDDFHPPHNVEKMQAGIPLTDDDRQGWLQRLVQEVNERLRISQPVVFTCSALKRHYRDILRQGIAGLGVLFLDLSEAEATQRVASRPGHFMPASLVHSQFQDLQPPLHEARVLTVSATQPIANLIEATVAWMQAQA